MAKSTRTTLDIFEALQGKVFCDAILRSQDGLFQQKVHRNIVSRKSPYLYATFCTGMELSNEINDGSQVVTISRVSSDILPIVVNFMYKEDMSEINKENVQELAIAADYMDVPTLRDACSNFMLENLEASNVVGILRFAQMYSYRELREEARHFLLVNFQQVIDPGNCEELMDMTGEELADILGEDKLNASSENFVWDVTRRWFEKDPEQRQNEVAMPFAKIRFALLDAVNFMNAAIFAIHHSLNSLTEWSLLSRARITPQVLFAIGGWSAGEPSSTIECWDSRTDRWKSVIGVQSMGRRAYHGCVVLGDEIFTIGGYDGVEYYNNCQKFNTITKTWTEISPMYCRRCYVSVAQCGGMIYAMGGYDGTNRQNSVERYDCRANQWTMVAPMNIQRSDADATSVNGKIVIVGGFNGHDCLDTAEVYDPVNNMWTMVPTPMSSRRSGVSCVAAGKWVYVVGGFNGQLRLDTAEKFNLRTSTWTRIASMNQGRSNFAMEVVDDKILAVGGFNGTTTIHDVERYDWALNAWEPVQRMATRRSALFACTMVLRNATDYLDADREIQVPFNKYLAFQEIVRHLTETAATQSTLSSPDNMVFDQSEDEMNDSIGL